MPFYDYSLILKEDGTVWGCGYNNFSQLGDGTTTTQKSLVQMSNATNVKAISCGKNHSLILKEDGTVWGCGYNSSGQLGDGTTTTRKTLVQMTDATNVKQIVCGENHSLILKEDGTVWGCGYNKDGQLGDGNVTETQKTLVQMTNATNVKQIVCGQNYSLILKKDGTVWGCGNNSNGQLGDGTTTTQKSLVQMTDATNVKAISCGQNHSLILKKDGTVWGCGNNSNCQVHSAIATYTINLTQMSNATNVKAISCGKNHSLILKEDGTVWGCGYNNYGQLGDGNTTETQNPLVQMSNATNVKAISCGKNHSLILKEDGTVWGCGYNKDGQLGDGTTTRKTLVQMTDATNVKSLINVIYHELFFLINANGKYYTTNGTTLTKVTSLNNIESEGFSDITLVNEYIKNNPTPEFTSYKIISSIDCNLYTKHYKSAYMMVLNKATTRQDVSVIQNNFITHNSDKFDIFYTFSLDNGTTWKTVDSNNNITNFPTFTMPTNNTSTEWETLKELVIENGISYSNKSFTILDDVLDELNFRIIIVLKMKDYIKESEANTKGISKIELRTTTIN